MGDKENGAETSSGDTEFAASAGARGGQRGGMCWEGLRAGTAPVGISNPRPRSHFPLSARSDSKDFVPKMLHLPSDTQSVPHPDKRPSKLSIDPKSQTFTQRPDHTSSQSEETRCLGSDLIVRSVLFSQVFLKFQKILEIVHRDRDSPRRR